ncbi:MAG: type II toxin-antitoxin system RelE/ParE family toxin [Acidobacteriaceae bacterium]
MQTLRSWPKQIRIDFGASLDAMQDGRKASLDVRPMPSVGPGVFELKDSDDKTWYRMMYLARVKDTIYVLHCFKKNTAKTEGKDLKTAQSRLSKVNDRIRTEKRDEKRKQGK